MNLIRFSFFILLFYITAPVFSQTGDNTLLPKHPATLKEYEDTLKVIGPRILQSETDSARNDNNEIFTQMLREALNLPNSFNYPFDSLKSVSIKKSDDNVLKTYTWTQSALGGTDYSFFGFVQIYDKKKKLTMLIELEDKHEEIEKAETKKLDAKNWYGALYYQILTDKYKKKATYTLIGWHGNNRQSTKKVIDVLTINNNRISFGAPVFRVGNRTQSRMIYEYNAQAVMSLKYEDRMKMIVMDHLSPPSPGLAKQPESFGPDFTYDAFKFNKGKWIFEQNIDVNNPSSADPKIKTKPQTDKIPPVGQ
ncbi:MAG: hypothetical protein ACR2GN_01245 [Bacteroidia bacterium]